MQLKRDLLFAERYVLIEKIQEGFYAEVWKVKRISGFVQAIKIYTGLDEVGNSLAKREFEQVLYLNHHRLLTPVDYGVSMGKPFLVMPYCASGSVQSKIGQLSESELLNLTVDISSALAFLHQQEPPIIHQEIKPDNILIDDAGHFLLADFGVSKRLRRAFVKSIAQQRITEELNPATAFKKATPTYNPPELFHSDFEQRTHVKASDIWSLGATLFELASGIPPFGEYGGLHQLQGVALKDFTDSKLSAEFKQLIQICLSKETWNRPTAQKIGEQAFRYFNSYKTNSSSIAKTKKLAVNIVGKKDNIQRKNLAFKMPLLQTPKESIYLENLRLSKGITFIKKNKLLVGITALAFSLLFLAFFILSSAQDKMVLKSEPSNNNQTTILADSSLNQSASKTYGNSFSINSKEGTTKTPKGEVIKTFDELIMGGDNCLKLNLCACAYDFYSKAKDIGMGDDVRIIKQKLDRLAFKCKKRSCRPKNASKSPDFLQIKQIELSATTTKITIVAKKTKTSQPLIIFAPQHSNAYTIKAKQLSYGLLQVDGIVVNEVIELMEKEQVFDLVFERLPQGIAIINLIAGARAGEIPNNFIGLDISCLN